MKPVEKVLTAEGCLAYIIILILCIVCLSVYFPYGLFVGAGIFYLRTRLLKKKHLQLKKEIESNRKKYLHERHQVWLKTPVWRKRGFLSEEAYLAEQEKVIRKREQDHFLARSYKQRQQLSRLKKNLSSIDDLFKLTPIEFEKWVKRHIFEKESWIATETKTTGDGGIDLVLNRKDEHSIAQCKRFKQTVGEPSIRDFYGTMISEGVSRGYFVTTGLFSLSAQKFAENKPIEMIDRRILAQKYL